MLLVYQILFTTSAGGRDAFGLLFCEKGKDIILRIFCSLFPPPKCYEAGMDEKNIFSIFFFAIIIG
jgi:hypothetical protein